MNIEGMLGGGERDWELFWGFYSEGRRAIGVPQAVRTGFGALHQSRSTIQKKKRHLDIKSK